MADLLTPTPEDGFTRRCRDLRWALLTRILTVAEMDEVRKLDYYICVPWDAAYKEAEARQEFHGLMFTQFKMRLEVERVAQTK